MVESSAGRKKCHYCGKEIEEDNPIKKIETLTGEELFYCSGKCCDDDWK